MYSETSAINPHYPDYRDFKQQLSTRFAFKTTNRQLPEIYAT